MTRTPEESLREDRLAQQATISPEEPNTPSGASNTRPASDPHRPGSVVDVLGRSRRRRVTRTTKATRIDSTSRAIAHHTRAATTSMDVGTSGFTTSSLPTSLPW